MQGRGCDQAPAPATVARGQLLGRYPHLQLPRRIGMQRGQIPGPFQSFECSGAQRGAMRGAVCFFIIATAHAQPRHTDVEQQCQHRQQHGRRRQDQRC
ncbi:hypothetical protein G6F56_014428 [Rhizopus delemar]|nr:hypothetical protein G6F56_014428 [Rhizopus delemar]